jgi:hypothetical protein
MLILGVIDLMIAGTSNPRRKHRHIVRIESYYVGPISAGKFAEHMF